LTQKESLGFVDEVFEVMAQVNRRLTKVNTFDWVTRVNLPGRKPGPSQPTPLKQNLVPRFDNKSRLHFLTGQGLQDEICIRLHF
jgi:hypothetical protein